MQDFHNLEAWKKSHRLTLAVFQATNELPKQESFGLTMQLRRTATNIPTRIAEGCSKEGDTEFARCLQLSRASCSELEYLVLLTRDLGYLTVDAHDSLFHQLVEIRKMLSGLLRTLSNN
jgi:four helix bundle protein